MTQSYFDRTDELRAFSAMLAVTVGVLICAHQRHFYLTWTRHSFWLMSRHRCGELMILATVWATAEILLLLHKQLNYNGLRNIFHVIP